MSSHGTRIKNISNTAIASTILRFRSVTNALQNAKRTYNIERISHNGDSTRVKFIKIIKTSQAFTIKLSMLLKRNRNRAKPFQILLSRDNAICLLRMENLDKKRTITLTTLRPIKKTESPYLWIESSCSTFENFNNGSSILLSFFCKTKNCSFSFSSTISLQKYLKIFYNFVEGVVCGAVTRLLHHGSKLFCKKKNLSTIHSDS